MTPWLGAWLDRLILAVAPVWTVRRQRARLAGTLLARHYEADALGRRTQGWARAGATDANAANTGARKREVARDLVRNNSYAESALSTIVDHAVGWGIVAKPNKTVGTAAARNQAAARWKAWAETTACDAEGRLDFAGLQKQVMRAVAQDGEVLIRRRWRRPEDNLPIPLQLQVLEADYLDSQRDSTLSFGGGRVIQGVEYDGIGRRAGYWLLGEHPGSAWAAGPSRMIPASEMLHVFKPGRPGQVRGVTWFAPVILKLKDFDDYEDAALLKQKIAACLAVITSDIDGTSPALGSATTQDPMIDALEPGMILNVAPGRSITVVDPPSVSEHAAYCQTILRAVATGIGVTYEDLTGDYQNLPFSAARMSRLRHWARVEDSAWMLIPQFCDPVWAWAMQAALVGGALQGADPMQLPVARATAPPAPMVEPDKEGLAYQRNIRSGLMTLSEALRERGYTPDEVLNEMAADNKLLDRLGLILDSDPRRTSQAGQPREAAKEAAPAALTPTAANGTNGRPMKEDE